MIGTKLSKTTLQMFIVARSVMFLACAALTFSGNKKAPYCAMGLTGLIILMVCFPFLQLKTADDSQQNRELCVKVSVAFLTGAFFLLTRGKITRQDECIKLPFFEQENDQFDDDNVEVVHRGVNRS